MRIRLIVIASTLIFLTTSNAFAQEYLKVNPVFLENSVDACFRLLHSISGGTSLHSVLPSNHLYVDLTSDHPRITSIDYNGTKLIVTLTPGIIGNMGLVYDHGNGMPPQIYKSNSSTLQQVDKITLKYGEYNKSGFTMAVVNTGNKDVTIAYPFASVLGIVLNSENGTSAYLDHHGISSNNPFADDKLWSLTWPEVGSVTLKPGQSVVQYYVLSRPPDVPSEYYHYPPSGNYTISSVARLLVDINGKCTMVYLWSPPIVLTVLSEDHSIGTKIPEFSLAVPVLLVSIISIVVLYRMKFK